MTTMSQQILEKYNWDIGKISLATQTVFPHRDIFRDLSKSFSELLQAPIVLFKDYPKVSELSSVEYFNEVNLVEVLHEDLLEPKNDDDFSEVRQELLEDTEDELPALLSKLSPEMVRMWDGALYALKNKDNPDRIRHFAASARELFTYVLHALTPDDEVKNWATSLDYINDGRPTRIGRLCYICKDIKDGSLKGFIKKDTRAILELYDLLNSGHHKIVSSYSEKELDVLLLRIEHYLMYLLNIGLKN